MSSRSSAEETASGVLPGGALVISLDFELIWGVRDKRTIADYGGNILGAREAVSALLDLFAERSIACTWATVGFLFFAEKEELLASLPEQRPSYRDRQLCPYEDLNKLGPDERRDPYRFARSLVLRIRDCPRQEIGTHTFSHFYCLEDGGDPEPFRADLSAAVTAAQDLGVDMTSIVFPRNQVAPLYLGICRELGFKTYRGTERVWFQEAVPESRQSILRRGVRLADAYLPIGGALESRPSRSEGMMNIPASRFMRPAGRGEIGRSLRLSRIVSAMRNAAKHGTVFHLWWHPHNFGADLSTNLAFLRTVLDSYERLHDEFGMRSMTMEEVARAARDHESAAGTAHI